MTVKQSHSEHCRRTVVPRTMQCPIRCVQARRKGACDRGASDSVSFPTTVYDNALIGTAKLCEGHWEALDVAGRVLGPHLSLAETPALASFYSGFARRGTCRALLEEHPCPITARPNEADAIVRLQSLPAGG